MSGYGGMNEAVDKGRILRASDYDRAIKMIDQGEQSSSSDLAELAALAELGLGKPLDIQTLLRLASVQTELRSRQKQYSDDLDDDKLSPEQYLDRIVVALSEAMRQNEEILGHKQFVAIYGKSAYEPENLIDRETFLGSSGKLSRLENE